MKRTFVLVPIGLAALAALTARPAAAASEAVAQSAVRILRYAETAGDLDAAQQLSTYFAKQADAQTRPLFLALHEQLQDGRWKHVLPATREAVAAFGFTFSLEPQGHILAEFARSVIRGLTPQLLGERIALARQLSEQFPKVPLYKALADSLAEVKAEDDKRTALGKQGRFLIETYSEELQELKRRQTPENFYEERRQQLQTTAAKEAREKERQRLLKQLMRGREMLTESYSYRAAAPRLRELIPELQRQIQEAEISGEF